MSRHRLFVALRPPQDIRQYLRQIMSGVAGVYWQEDDQLHITLRFIGEVNYHQAQDIAAALGGLHAPMPEIRLSGVGQFEKQGRTQALWAGIAPAEPLRALHQKINMLLSSVGIAPETRAFLPHITLARMSRHAGPPHGFLTANNHLSSAYFRCEHAILYESEMTRSGSAYLPVARYPLAAVPA